MERIEFRVSGKVQGVGFRFRVLQASQNFEVKGFVKNLDSGKVLVEAEGEKEQLELFFDTVKNFSFTEITGTKVKWKKFLGEFRDFSVRH